MFSLQVAMLPSLVLFLAEVREGLLQAVAHTDHSDGYPSEATPTPEGSCCLHLSAAGSSGRFESTIKGPTHAPSAQTWKLVSVALHTQTPLWNAHEPPKSGPCIPGF